MVNILREQCIVSNGHQVQKTGPGEFQCCGCGKVKKYSKPSGQGEPWEREQHLGGYCSDECWPFKDKNDC